MITFDRIYVIFYSLHTNTRQNVGSKKHTIRKCQFILRIKHFFTRNVISMVAYFCHHLSDIYDDLSDLYVDLSDLYVDLSDLYVDLSLIPSGEK